MSRKGRHRRPSSHVAASAAVAAASGGIAALALTAAPAQAAAITQGSTPPPVRAVADSVRAKIITRPAEVTVRPGDSLSKIAGEFCPSPKYWTGILAANRGKISDPDLIYPGEKLKISCRVAPLPAVTADAVTVRRHYAAPVSSEVVGTSGMGSFQSCVITRESGGRTQVMNSSGHYGLYQFDLTTWESGGGSAADFGHASVAEQNRVFASVYAARGTNPWAAYDGC